MSNLYSYADKAIKDMNRRNLRAFDKLKQLKFDELNVFEAVTKTYDDSVRLAKKRYEQIGYYAYLAAVIRAKIGEKKAKEMAEDSITEDWVLDMMEDYDAVTLYRFFPETERKKQRTVEAIIAAQDKGEAIDRALRLWTLQITHYADKSVDEAMIDGYKAAGVKKVKWITAEDDRVCNICRSRNGKVYQMGKLPTKPHYYCRCYFLPVLD